MVMGLTTSLWVQAQVRLCDRRSIPAVIVRRGDADAGAVLVKVNRFEAGSIVYAQMTDADGEAAWMRGTGVAPVQEADADAYIERQVRRDSDIWVIEIEDRRAEYVLDGEKM